MIKNALLFFLLSIFSFGQQTDILREENYTVETHVYNIGINAIIGGVGSVINKRKDEKWGKAFLRGFGFGAVGGYIKLKGKALNQLIDQRQTPEFAWLSKTVYFAGNSIVENASSNEPVFNNWHYMIGFLRFDYNINENRFRTRLMPVSFIGTVGTVFYADQFDLNLTLRTGSIIFIKDYQSEFEPFGESLFGTIVLNSNNEINEFLNFNNNNVIGHEHVHELQSYDFTSINNSIFSNTIQNNNFLKKADKFIYWDVSPLFQAGLYEIFRTDRENVSCRFNNFFEAEAEWFTDRRLVQCQ